MKTLNIIAVLFFVTLLSSCACLKPSPYPKALIKVEKKDGKRFIRIVPEEEFLNLIVLKFIAQEERGEPLELSLQDRNSTLLIEGSRSKVMQIEKLIPKYTKKTTLYSFYEYKHRFSIYINVEMSEHYMDMVKNQGESYYLTNYLALDNN